MPSPNTMMIDIIILKKIEEASIKFHAFYGQPPFMIIFNPIFKDRLNVASLVKNQDCCRKRI